MSNKAEHFFKFKKTINSQTGVALLMVMSSIAILAFLLIDFTYETKVNKLRVYNQIDKTQARLNAESGILLALSKLRLYQEGHNLIEKREDLKKAIGLRPLESLTMQPFIFPVSQALLKKANLLERTAINDFLKSIILEGELSVTISSVSGLLNPNNLRIPDSKPESDKNSQSSSQPEDKKKLPPHAYFEKKFVETLNDAFMQKKEKDEEFDAQYGNLDAELLIKELKYYVNAPDSFDGPEKADIEGRYAEDGTYAKHAPLSSISEIALLKGWDDVIADLIKDKMTVHEATIIPINELTKSQLKFLFPSITDEQVTEYFKYKNGDEKDGMPPKEFLSVADFKSAITRELNIMDEKSYDERIQEFENAGVKLGVAGKLFKVVSRGVFGRASYTLTAFIDLPVRPVPKPKKKKSNDPNVINDPDSNDPDLDPGSNPDQQKGKKEKAPPTQLMTPRIVELLTE